MANKTIIITGLAGFIPSSCSTVLRDAGWKVFGIDNFSNFYSKSWKEANLRAIGANVASSNIQFEQADITDAAAIDRIFSQVKPDAVLHLAAMAGVRPSIEQPAYYMKINMEGTANLLNAAVKNKTQKFVFASSSSVYGNQGSVPFSEEDPVMEPISPYAASKRAGELLCHTYWHLYKLPIFCLRFFTVYGPRQRPDLAIHKFSRLILENKPIPVFGDGTTSRDYTYIEDIARGVHAAIDKCDRYRIYNIGGSDPVSLSDLIAGIEKAVGKKAIIDRKPAQPGDVERTYACLKRSTAELGYKPQVSIQEGLNRFAAWLKEHAAEYPYDFNPKWKP